MLEQEDRIWRGLQAQAAAASSQRFGRSSQNSVFNCSAHAPTMNIALPHYRAPCVTPTERGAELLPQSQSIQVQPAPTVRWGCPRLGRPTHKPDQLSHHIIARRIYRGDRQVTGNYNQPENIYRHLKSLLLLFCYYFQLALYLCCLKDDFRLLSNKGQRQFSLRQTAMTAMHG